MAHFKGIEVLTKCLCVDADNIVEDEDDAPVCSCKAAAGAECCVDNKCTNFAMQIECVECSPACRNNRIRLRRNAAMSVRETPGKGHGLFIEQDLPRNAFVMEYVGEVISAKEFVRRNSERKGDVHAFIMIIKRTVYIDARNKGNESRFINHSCEPNCTTGEAHLPPDAAYLHPRLTPPPLLPSFKSRGSSTAACA